MKILMLQDDLYDYLTFVIKSHAQAGIEPEEGLALYHLNRAVRGAQTVDAEQAAKVAIAPSGDASVEVEPANESSGGSIGSPTP